MFMRIDGLFANDKRSGGKAERTLRGEINNKLTKQFR